ncbi:hypothetical protein [Natronomonas amylolytica]|uniref:hypothetical protein n=1 Tax=Natronomonas amylolytica TaxID=3108498 RepID=UPI003008C71B
MRRRRYLAGLSTALGVAFVGCTDDGTERSDPNEAYRNAFRTTLTDEGITIRRFEVREGVVALEYAPAEATEASVEESVRTAGGAYYDRIYGGWDVDRLEAEVFVDGSLVATWHMESRWVRQHRDGDISRDELGEKIQATVKRHDE